eukprot:CAMPEP_0177662320 /NCGR_PEP_ID=MMETSP0447-20121125/19220_1 /TAXON_ID=0 /ORGANISM="Stygamoeba regulata, Strain BSH-02190019" /LENGTH=285 /DNA_ID=CAMNT_0019167863 /DNA_START=9 /DNA_END=863 /DNA_ORIENTATION=+
MNETAGPGGGGDGVDAQLRAVTEEKTRLRCNLVKIKKKIIDTSALINMYTESDVALKTALEEKDRQAGTIQRLNREVSELQADRAKWKGTEDKLILELHQCRADLASTKDELAAAKEANKGLKMEVKTWRKESSGLKTALQEQKRAQKALQASLDKAMAALQATSEAKREGESKAQAELERLRAEVALLSEEGSDGRKRRHLSQAVQHRVGKYLKGWVNLSCGFSASRFAALVRDLTVRPPTAPAPSAAMYVLDTTLARLAAHAPAAAAAASRAKRKRSRTSECA